MFMYFIINMSLFFLTLLIHVKRRFTYAREVIACFYCIDTAAIYYLSNMRCTYIYIYIYICKVCNRGSSGNFCTCLVIHE